MSLAFSRPDADVYLDRSINSLDEGLARVTHLCVAAHQDDIEIMAYSGIVECFDGPPSFAGVVVTNGAGSPRAGVYSKFSDAQMQRVRREEQRSAAQLGRYAVQIQLAHSSDAVKQPTSTALQQDLTAIFSRCRPEKVYLHNPLDKHDTHVAVFLRTLEALRELPLATRPSTVLGCAVWRDLEWMVEGDKLPLETGQNPSLAEDLLRVFDSQIAGGKRYDLATLGRRQANATFDQHHSTDSFAGITWAMDLTPLVKDSALDVSSYALGYVERLRNDVASRIRKFSR